MPYRTAFAPHFGIFHLNITDAGTLISKCLWFRGEIKLKHTPKKSFAFDDPELSKLLEKPSKHYADIVRSAILDKRLPTAKLQQSPDGNIVDAHTYVEAITLADWLEDCGVILGEAFEDEYIPTQEHLACKVAMMIAAEQHGQSGNDMPQNTETIFLRQRNMQLEAELETIKSQTPAHAPISEKQRGAYLNIIGAFLGLMLGKSPAGKPYSPFESQQAIIDAMHGMFGEAPGLSERNLAAKFAEGKRTLAATSKA